MSSPGGVRTLLEELEARDLLELARKCARSAHVTLDEMLSKDRAFPATRARAAFYAALIEEGWNPHALGRLMRRHHSTVQYALDRYAPKRAASSPPASGVVPVASPAPLASCRPSTSAPRARPSGCTGRAPDDGVHWLPGSATATANARGRRCSARRGRKTVRAGLALEGARELSSS